jgi:hypothetical protein
MADGIVLTKSLIAANAALYAASQTPVSGTPLTLTGTAADTQRRVLLTYGSEAAPRTLFITGTTDAGNTISETLAVPSGAGGTVASQQDFLTISSAVPAGGGWTAPVTLGTNTTGSTRWVVSNPHITPSIFSLGMEFPSGSATATTEGTDDSPLAQLPIYLAGYISTVPIPVPYAVPGLKAVNADARADINSNFAAIRLTINSGDGLAQLTIRQAGISGP